MLSLAGPRFISVAKPTSSRSLLGKAPPYLSSLVTIATHTRSTHSSRHISQVIPKANTSFGPLSFQFSTANDWNELQKSLKLETYISLSQAAENWKERRPKEVLALTSEIYLLEHVLPVGVAMVTSELR